MSTPPPEPRPTTQAGQPGPTLSDAVIEAAVERSLEQARRDGTSPHVVIGNTPPVPQPDNRIVPSWAVGLAVASIGVGAGTTGLGCAAWLAMQGLSAVSVPSLERFAWIIIAPFVGVAMAATAIGSAFKRAGNAGPREVHNHGPVTQDFSEDHSRTRHFTFKTRNDTTINPEPPRKGRR
jgi:hypothetical protein